MPTATRPPPPPPTPQRPLPSLPANRLRGIAAPLAFAAGAALLELLAGLFLGAFPLTQRAEAFLFLLSRPWIVLLLALAVAPLGWRRRTLAYAAFLILAGASEALYMHRLGNAAPWAEMLRGWGTGALAAIVADPVLSLARRRRRPLALAAAAALAAVLAVPAVREGHEKLIAAPAPAAPAGPRPDVLLMTALPLVWGEGGAFDPASRPAAIYTALQREFTLRPIDALDRASLGSGRLLLLIQPRWLAPEELVALDAWVRRGGRALVLTDPQLNWHSDLPLGDVRRPPPAGLLEPLLGHWGLAMQPGQGRQLVPLPRGRLLHIEEPGRLASLGPSCRAERPFLARCSIGAGRAIVLADADLVRDELWHSGGPARSARHRRRADNPLVLADLLDELAGLQRQRILGDARWRDPGRSPSAALLWALLPLGGILVGAGLTALLPRRRRAR